MQRRKRGMSAGDPRQHRSVIAAHLIHSLYGHWAVNDPRGSGSTQFGDFKFKPLGPIHHGRKPDREQPTREHLRAFHQKHRELLNFPAFWIDEAKRREFAFAVEQVIAVRGYTCYACAICSNHFHLLIRTHRDRAPVMWEHFATSARERLRLRFPEEISPHHPVLSARPYNVLLFTPAEVWDRVTYIEGNPKNEGLPPQHWRFVTPYDNWPVHKPHPGHNA